jgi:hypothetical protein
MIVRKRSREFARIPVEEYGIMGEQKANSFYWLVWVARPLKGISICGCCGIAEAMP